MPTTTPTVPETPSTKNPKTQNLKQRNRSGPRTKHGSYRQYYNRRNDALHVDDRLTILRDVCKRHSAAFSFLDIGCNDGTITTELASLETCSRAVGIDINPNLIGDARKKLRTIIEKRRKGVHSLQGPLPAPCDSLPLNVRQVLQLGRDLRNRNGVLDNSVFPKGDGEPKFPANVTFRTEDFAQPEATKTSRELEQFDIVFCLSVTKWVHFAWGDDGLVRMFRRIYDCLKPGGILVLEPQPLKSYKSAIRKGLGKKDVTGERKIKPHQFPGCLKFSIGFQAMKLLRDVRERGHAFNRPIMAFLKGSCYPWNQVFASPLPYSAFMQHRFHDALDPVPQVHQPIVPPVVIPDVVLQENMIPADPSLQNVVPANPAPANAAPANEAPPNVAPLNAATADAPSENPPPVNATPANTGTSAAVPNTRGQLASVEKDEARQAGGAIEVEQEEAIRVSSRQANCQTSALDSNEMERQPINGPSRVANGSAPDSDDVERRAAGYKRTRPDDGAEESEERRSKAPKRDTDETEQ